MLWRQTVADDPWAGDLVTFMLTVCSLCLNGAGGECHMPGCVFWMCPAPDEEQGGKLMFAALTDLAAASPEGGEGRG